MSAERLREAAQVLRGHIDGLTTDRTRWDDSFPVSRIYADKSTYERLIVHPGVGLALAEWLDAAARFHETYAWPEDVAEARKVADLILGDVP